MKELRGKSFWIVLLLGLISSAFVGGSFNVDLLALLSPVFFLLITRNTSKPSDIVLCAIAMGVGGAIKYPNLLWMGFPYDQAVAFLVVMILILPYLADRFIYRNFAKNASLKRKFAATFILPTLFAIFEEICNYSFLGTTFAVSITQNDILPFMEFASVVGQFGLAFIVMWVPSFIYFLIDVYSESERKSAAKLIDKVKVPVAIFTIFFVAVLTFGELRLCLKSVGNDYVRVAYAHGVVGTRDSHNVHVVDPLDKLEKVFSEQVGIASKNGAKLVCFNEEAFYVEKNSLYTFLDYVAKETKANQIYALVGIETTASSDEELPRNLAVMAGPDGKILSEYDKSKLIPFMELGNYEPGDGHMPILSLQLSPNTQSVVSTAICFEGEFGSYINQVGPETDIHLNPSYEWIPYAESHSKTIQLRAIEHGMSVVEPTVHNTDAIFDCLGRLVATSNTDTHGFDTVTFGDIPAVGVYTPYVLGGFILDYLYIIGLVIFICLAVVRKKQFQSNDDNKKS